MANEFYNWHNSARKNGVTHARYNELLLRERVTFLKQLATDNQTTASQALKNLTPQEAKKFVDHIMSFDETTEIGRFIRGVQYEVEMAEQIGRQLGKNSAAVWGKAHARVQTVVANIATEEAKIASRAQRGLPPLKSQATKLAKLRKALANHEKTMLEVIQKLELKSGLTAVEVVRRSVQQNVAHVTKAMAKGSVVGKIGKAAKVAGAGAGIVAKGLAKPLVVFGAYTSFKEGGVVNGVFDVGTDFIPGFALLKLTMRYAVGEENYKRALNMTHQERADAFSAGWKRLESWNSGVSEFRLRDGHRIRVNDSELKSASMKSPSKVVSIRPTDEPGVAIVRLADGHVFRVGGFRDLDAKEKR